MEIPWTHNIVTFCDTCKCWTIADLNDPTERHAWLAGIILSKHCNYCNSWRYFSIRSFIAYKEAIRWAGKWKY